MNCKSSHRQKMLNGGEGAREAENELKRKKKLYDDAVESLAGY